MLNSQTRVPNSRLISHRLFVGVQHRVVGRVSDRVGRNLEASPQATARQCENAGLSRCYHAFRARFVGVRFEKRRAARAERAVREEFDRPDGQLITR